MAAHNTHCSRNKPYNRYLFGGPDIECFHAHHKNCSKKQTIKRQVSSSVEGWGERETETERERERERGREKERERQRRERQYQSAIEDGERVLVLPAVGINGV